MARVRPSGLKATASSSVTPALVERALVTLATNRGLLLVGE
ncbi:hypothetical protein [Kitasatospora sp. NPDC093558]